MKRTVEILAPAGDMICLQAALNAGADAVYFGLDDFNMRQMAVNAFNFENLPEVSRRCRERGVKLYLTLNTVVFEDELARVAEFAEQAKPFVDAVIAADWGVIGICRKAGIPFHVSTQMSCANSAAAEFLKSQGASRVVLARECTLEELGRIARKTDIELEVFVHGAVCVAVSGRCFLSHHAYGQSSNRGECFQPCRREYHIREVREGDDADAEFIVGRDYVLSAKDLCSLPFLDKIIAAGACSLKIEGRARNADYVKAVVEAYREARDAVLDGTFSEELAQRLVVKCEQVYHRPFAEGLFHGRPGADQFTQTDENAALEKKKHLGIVANYYAKAGIAHVQIQDNGVKPGDRLSFQGGETGVVYVTADEIRQDERILAVAGKGEWFTVKCPERVRTGDKVFLVVKSENV